MTINKFTMLRVVQSAALFVIVLCAVPSSQSQPPQTLWRKLEDALVQSDDFLFNLSQIFFPPNSWGDGSVGKEFSFTVRVTVDKLDDSEFVPSDGSNESAALCCSTNMGYCTVWVSCDSLSVTLGRPGFEASSNQISKLLSGPEVDSVFTAFDPAFYYLMKKLSDEALELNSILTYQEIHQLNFHIDELATMPTNGELYKALASVLTWAKAYARAHGRPYEWLDKDRFAVISPTDSLDQDTSMLISPATTSVLLMCAFLLANLLLMMVTIMNFDDIHLWLRRGSKTRALYKGSGIVLAMFNLATFTFEIILLNRFISDPSIPFYYVSVKLPLMIVVFTVEIVTVSYNTYKHRPMKCLPWIAHTFASCHILWFVHRVVTDAIISITSFIVAPAQTLGVLTLILSTIACVTAFVAYLIHRGLSGLNRRTCLAMLGGVVVGVTTCGLVFIFTLLFIALVDNGLKSTGIGGFILSLIPPTIIFVAGLLVEWRLSTPYVSHRSNKLSDSLSCSRERTEPRKSKRRAESRADKTVSHLLSTVSDLSIEEKGEEVVETVSTVDETTPLVQ